MLKIIAAALAAALLTAPAGSRKHAKADWQFTTANARIKLRRLYRVL